MTITSRPSVRSAAILPAFGIAAGVGFRWSGHRASLSRNMSTIRRCSFALKDKPRRGGLAAGAGVMLLIAAGFLLAALRDLASPTVGLGTAAGPADDRGGLQAIGPVLAGNVAGRESAIRRPTPTSWVRGNRRAGDGRWPSARSRTWRDE